jgi:hypothetical protein
MIDTESVEAAKAALGYWLQYPLPVIGGESTECERIWHQFLTDKRLALQALSA